MSTAWKKARFGMYVHQKYGAIKKRPEGWYWYPPKSIVALNDNEAQLGKIQETWGPYYTLTYTKRRAEFVYTDVIKSFYE